MPHIHELFDWVVTVFIVRDGKVLLIKHRKLGKWLPVGGYIELDEDPEQALFREVKEECGLEIELIGSTKPSVKGEGFKPLPSPVFLDVHDISSTHKHIGLTYFARAKSADAKLAEAEHHAIRWFSREDLRDPKYGIMPGILFYAESALKMEEYIKKSGVLRPNSG